MEHFNRRLKMALSGLHANVTPTAIQRIGRSLVVVHHICDTLAQGLHMKKTSDCYAPPSFSKDFQVVLECLEQAQVFLHIAHRKYVAFPFRQGLLQEVDMSKVMTWLRTVYSKRTD